MIRCPDNQINASFIDISRIKWLVLLLWSSFFRTTTLTPIAVLSMTHLNSFQRKKSVSSQLSQPCDDSNAADDVRLQMSDVLRPTRHPTRQLHPHPHRRKRQRYSHHGPITIHRQGKSHFIIWFIPPPQEESHPIHREKSCQQTPCPPPCRCPLHPTLPTSHSTPCVQLQSVRWDHPTSNPSCGSDTWMTPLWFGHMADTLQDFLLQSQR